MNDPQVVALIYIVEHGDSVSYENAESLYYGQSSEFDLTVDDKIARFEFKTFYADEDEAIRAIEPFKRHWEFETALRSGPGSFKLRFRKAEIIDRNPSPPEPGVMKLRASLHLPAPTLSGSVVLGFPHYPSPPSGGIVKPDDPDVKSMFDRYKNYCSGREYLPSMAYFCLTMLEYKFEKQKREQAAAKYNITKKVLCKLGKLSAIGGPIGRKGGTVPLTENEQRWLKEIVRKIIFRAAQVAADDRQCLPQITMADLPNL